MGDLAGEDRTVLFVSHNMGAIRQLCPRSILLEGGKLLHDGPTPEALRVYHESLREGTIDSTMNLAGRMARGTGAARFTSLRVENESREPEWDFRAGESVRIPFSYEVFEPVNDLRFYFALQSGTHRETLTTVSRIIAESPLPQGATGSFCLELPELNLRPGDYYIYAWLGSGVGVGYDVLDSQSASFPPLTVWSNETDPHKTAGFFSIPATLTAVDPLVAQQQQQQ
jgi:lipopolysaccharide transport system ATP-binding protein